jgi:hypothetical protein
MKKALFVFVIFVMALGIAFAQGGRVVTIYFHNGSIVKGVISKLPNEERFKLQLPNNSFILFVSSEVKDILYEDGTRPGGAARPSQFQSGPQQQPYQQQPAYQQQQPGRAYVQPQPQPRQEVYPRQGAGQAPLQNRVARTEPPVEEEIVEEEEAFDEEDYLSDEGDFSGGEEDFLAEEDEGKALRPGSRGAVDPRQTVAPRAAVADFVPGYHGMVDFGYTFGLDSLHAFNRMELTLTQGYQFSPSLFAGLGFGVHLYTDSVMLGRIVPIKEVQTEVQSKLSYAFPVFVDVRYNLMRDRRILPFVNLKLGYSIGILTYSTEVLDESGQMLKRTETMGEGLGFFAAPSVGVKFMLGRSLAFSLGAGYSMQVYRSDRFKDVTYTSIIKKTDTMGGLTLRAGLEF